MTIQIQYTGNLSAKNGVKCVGYGGAGVGKTRLAVTAPRPIILSAEQGLLSVKKENVPFILIKSMKDLEEAHKWMTQSAESKKYDTGVLDSISEIAEQIISEERTKSKDPRKVYPEYQMKMLDIFRDFRDMPQKHIYFIAKEGRNQGPDNTISAGPSFPGKVLPEAAPYFFDQVFQIVAWTDPATSRTQNALRCRKDLGYEAKDRSGALDLWEPPNLTAMFNKIMQS